MPRGGTPKHENGYAPSLGRGQQPAAAAGVVRKPVESANRSAGAKSGTTPAGPSAQHPLLR